MGRLMALDMADHECSVSGRREVGSSAILARRCFIAQPVGLGKKCAPVLRFAIGALQVTEAYAADPQLDGMLAQLRADDVAAIEKLVMLLADWPSWSVVVALQSPVNRAKMIF